MKKVLYFEGAGMDFKENEFSNVGNYRIRTAFTNNDGIKYYIEMGRSPRYTKTKSGKLQKVSDWALRIDHLFIYEDGNTNEKHEIKTDWKIISQLDYTKESITVWINQNLNCNFDTIEVLDMFHGYRVHGDNGMYNLIDYHNINHELATKRREAYNELDMEYRRLTGNKYSVIGLKAMDDNSITVSCHASEQRLGINPRVKTIQFA